MAATTLDGMTSVSSFVVTIAAFVLNSDAMSDGVYKWWNSITSFVVVVTSMFGPESHFDKQLTVSIAYVTPKSRKVSSMVESFLQLLQRLQQCVLLHTRIFNTFVVTSALLVPGRIGTSSGTFDLRSRTQDKEFVSCTVFHFVNNCDCNDVKAPASAKHVAIHNKRKFMTILPEEQGVGTIVTDMSFFWLVLVSMFWHSNVDFKDTVTLKYNKIRTMSY